MAGRKINIQVERGAGYPGNEPALAQYGEEDRQEKSPNPDGSQDQVRKQCP